MNSRASESGPSAERAKLFAATQWSLVVRAQDKSEVALETLFSRYRQPLLVWLRANGYSRMDSEDLLHGFLHGFLRRDALREVAAEKGKFRTFLLRCLKNHIRDDHDRTNAAKRGGGQIAESLDATDEQGQTVMDVAASGGMPGSEFDRAWAQALLERSVERLRLECAGQGHGVLWSALEPVLFFDDTASPYRTIATELGMSEGAVKMAASRLRARLRGLVQEEIQQTVTSEEDFAEEIRYFIHLFGSKT